MNSSILGFIGLGNLDPAILFIIWLVLIILLFVLLIIQSSKLKKLEKKYDKFMQGKEAASLEEEITGLFHDNRLIRNENEKNRKDIISINKRLSNSFQKYGLEKYDASRNDGGKLSFAICMLDEKDNGFILNSVHNSDGSNYTYSKAINAGVSEIELTKNEKVALEDALNSTSR
jgi:hypothetical protein